MTAPSEEIGLGLGGPDYITDSLYDIDTSVDAHGNPLKFLDTTYYAKSGEIGHCMLKIV